MPLPTIAESPASFVPLAKAINTIARALNSATGTRGLKVTVSEGKIVFELAGTLDVDISGTAAFASEADWAFEADYAANSNIANTVVGTGVTISSELLTLRTIEVCDGGVTKSMYVLGSATF
jgi:hypothetical protein